MASLTQKRIEIFKSNKRGYISLWIFGTLLIASLFAEVIANDKPIYVEYNGKSYFPFFQEIAETEFGGVFETEANYKDPSVRKLIEENGKMIMPPIEYSYQFSLGSSVLTPPSENHLLGTDDNGRDVAARIIYGFRLSILFGLALTIATSIIGVSVGAITGFFGGWMDIFMQRFMEMWSSIPQLFLLIIISSTIVINIWLLWILLTLFLWMNLVDYVRAEVLRARKLEYVRAARALGVKQRKIIFNHILPNALVSTFTYIPFILTSAITTLATMDFLGFGLPSSYPSLGELTLQGKNNLDAPWLGITAFVVLSVMLSLLVFIGEALRDAFDPRKTIC